MKLVRGGDWAGGTIVEREVGTRKQTRDESRAELCSVFMAVIRILLGSEKGGGDGGVILTTTGCALKPATREDCLDCILKRLR